MRYGIEIGATGKCDALALAELAHLAEEAGWDGIFLEDYIIHWLAPDAPTYDPWVVLAAMAISTKRIRLGTTITPLPRRRPWKLARETVTIDHLSHGRLILGVGIGGVNDWRNFDQLGEVTNPQQRAKMLDEGLEVLAGLWSGRHFDYTGDYYQIDGLTFLPTPFQTPRIPIWVGGGWPGKPIRRSVKWDGFVPYKTPADEKWQDLTPGDIQRMKAFIYSRRTPSEPFDIAIGGRVRNPDWKQERAWIQSLADAGATWWMEHIPPADLDQIRAWIKRGPLQIE